MSISSGTLYYNKVAGISFVLLLPPLFFVSAAVLKYGLGIGYLFDILEPFYANPNRLRVFNIVSPILFLSGLFLAIALNLYPIFRLSIRKDNDTTVYTITVKAKLWNLSVIAMSFLLLAILIGYAFLENFTHR
ncbi:hypothetical protein HYR99_14160 [Candidatus Poribacteria bacterium]|nr:hypothetical protein [Candidatus Poribacteria bacterium]